MTRFRDCSRPVSMARPLRELQRRCLDGGVFCSLDELAETPQTAILVSPVRWTTTAGGLP